MSRRHPGGHKLPDNPTWIEITRSDGDTRQLPKNTTQVVDSEGQVNFMRPVGLDESLAVMWRVSVGAALAVKMNMPKGPSYVLKTFPEGYHFYDHNKGPVKNPRHDPYLIGSVHVNRFRSTNEFIPHALWLLQDETMNRANCQCKYCTKQPQRIISDTMGISARRSSSVLAPRLPRQRQTRDPRERRAERASVKPYAAVRRAPKPPRVLVGPQQHITPESDLDVRCSISVGEGCPPRRYRKGEVLWCHIDPPIRGQNPDEDITFWPGIIEDYRVKTHHIPAVLADADTDMTPLYKEAQDEGPSPTDQASSGGNGQSADTTLAEAVRVPWTVQQWYIYNIKLLGTTYHAYLTDERVLPYLAYAPSTSVVTRVHDELTDYLRVSPIEEVDRTLEGKLFDFDPMKPESAEEQLPSNVTKYRQAAAPYTLAVQIAAQLAQYWLPTDEWECKFQIPRPEPVPSSSSQQPPLSTPDALHSLIQKSLANSATAPLEPTAAPGPIGLGAEPESISTGARLPRNIGSPVITQTRFQGLWWGTERLWTGEFMRLKIARCQFAPDGTDVIFPPSGPSAATLEYFKTAHPELASNSDAQLFGAAERGLFLRLDGLFIVDIPGPNGSTVKECRACGMAYELADHDWEEAAPPSEQNGIDEKGKGKAREVHDTEMSDVHQENGGEPSMNEPSPLKPPPLPNPDPTVPVSETASSVQTQLLPESAPAASAPEKKANDLAAQLSRPVLTSSYPVPPASRGYKFRPILPPDYEIVVALSLLSGRYYPGLLGHPLLVPAMQIATASPDGAGQNRQLLALDGLVPGVHQSMDPRFWRGSRQIMLQDADKEARGQFKEWWEETKMARLHPQPEDNNEPPMEVD